MIETYYQGNTSQKVLDPRLLVEASEFPASMTFPRLLYFHEKRPGWNSDEEPCKTHLQPWMAEMNLDN